MKLKIKQLATVRMGYSFRSRLEASRGGEVAVIQMKDLLQDNTVGCKKLEEKSRLSQDVIAGTSGGWITEMKDDDLVDLFRLTL